MSDSLGRLAATLGVPSDRLTPLTSYDDKQLSHLDKLLTDAMAAEEKAFDSALEEALGFVPRPLRGTAKRILGGGGRG